MVLLEELIVAQLVKKSSPFLFSQDPSDVLCHKLDESSPHLHTVHLEDEAQCRPPIYFYVYQVGSSLKAFRPRFALHSSPSVHATRYSTVTTCKT